MTDYVKMTDAERNAARGNCAWLARLGGVKHSPTAGMFYRVALTAGCGHWRRCDRHGCSYEANDMCHGCAAEGAVR